MKKIIFPTSHGVELGLEPGYSKAFNEAILDRVPAIYRQFIVPHEFSWHVIVDERQRETWEMEKDLGSPHVRLACVKIACDVLWYRASKGTANGIDVFGQIHRKLETELDILLEQYPDASIVLHGHSLGSCIVFDHCWETKHRIAGLFTTGSPITKYSGMYPEWGHLPGKDDRTMGKELDFWVNFVTWRDLVCSSFRNHKSPQFREFVEDVQIGSWNPLNFPYLKRHGLYWKHPDVHQRVADTLVRYLLKMNGAEKKYLFRPTRPTNPPD